MDIDYKGSLAFPVKLNSGKIEKSEKGYLAAFTGENLYGLNLEFITDKIAAAPTRSTTARWAETRRSFAVRRSMRSRPAASN